jgi:2-polyprenyl-6-methoxyphenol hydroxylase-like FAD-dependent oxidoreductase
MLAPNAMRILDEIGLLVRIQKQGYNFDTIFFKDSAGQTTSQFLMGSTSRYGYQAMRIPRHTVVTELRTLATERGIPIHFEKQISRVLEESQNGVTFQFADGLTGHAKVLIGADGIYSNVRDYVCPGRSPAYSGQLAPSVVVQQRPRGPLEGPSSSLPAIFHGRNGALLMLPQSFDGSEVVIGTQLQYPEQDRAGWTRLANNRNELLHLFKQGVGEWQDVVPFSLEHVQYNAISIWPYYALPDIPSWVSEGKKVILVGDAAHAMPPTAGQGACQAIEDAATLAVLFSESSSFPDLTGLDLELWEKVRRERVERVKALTVQLGNNRLPQKEREKLPKGHYWNTGEQPDLFWLYGLHVGKEFSRLYTDHMER